MSDESPSRILDKIIIRLPDGLKERIRRVAVENGRSVNAELLTLLEQAYPADARLDEYVLGIAAIINAFPEAERGAAWDRVLEKIDQARRGTPL